MNASNTINAEPLHNLAMSGVVDKRDFDQADSYPRASRQLLKGGHVDVCDMQGALSTTSMQKADVPVTVVVVTAIKDFMVKPELPAHNITSDCYDSNACDTLSRTTTSGT
ncbi:hypothetical protein MRX96_015157 [Rhipicephalus microplus]